MNTMKLSKAAAVAAGAAMTLGVATPAFAGSGEQSKTSEPAVAKTDNPSEASRTTSGRGVLGKIVDRLVTNGGSEVGKTDLGSLPLGG